MKALVHFDSPSLVSPRLSLVLWRWTPLGPACGSLSEVSVDNARFPRPLGFDLVDFAHIMSSIKSLAFILSALIEYDLGNNTTLEKLYISIINVLC